jgi:hypothetical protein
MVAVPLRQLPARGTAAKPRINYVGSAVTQNKP